MLCEVRRAGPRAHCAEQEKAFHPEPERPFVTPSWLSRLRSRKILAYLASRMNFGTESCGFKA
jgi:hypothetical protein